MAKSQKDKVSNSPDHLNWSAEQIQEFLLSQGNTGYLTRWFKYMCQRMEELTSFMDHIEGVHMKARLVAIREGIHSAEDIPKCQCCGKDARIRKYDGMFAETCSTKCMNLHKGKAVKSTVKELYGDVHFNATPEVRAKREKTIKEKYGEEYTNASQAPEVKDKIKKTNFDRYGDEVASRSDIVREKWKKTFQERYGVDSIGKAFHRFDDKRKVTMKERYGHEHPMHSDEVKEKVKQTNRDNWGTDWFFQSEIGAQKKKEGMLTKTDGAYDNPFKAPDYRERMKQSRLDKGLTHHHLRTPEVDMFLSDYDFMYDEYVTKQTSILTLSLEIGTAFGTVKDALISHGIEIRQSAGVSGPELEMLHFIKTECGISDDDIVSSDRKTLKGKEIDILIPEKNIGIEFDGIYYHSDKFKEPDYHLNKTKEAKEQGINLVHIFSDEWHYKQDVVKSYLRSILSPEKESEDVTMSITMDSMDDFHATHNLQGPTESDFSVMGTDSLGNPLYAVSVNDLNDGVYQITRFSNPYNHGDALTNVLSHLCDEHDVTTIVAQTDRRTLDPILFEVHGFEEFGGSDPSYMFVNQLERQETDDGELPKVYDCGGALYSFMI